MRIAVATTLAFCSIVVCVGSVALAGWEYQYGDASSHQLSEVHFADLWHGWAIGSGGTILRTTDGGVSWDNCDTFGYGGYAIHFVDPLVGWAAGGECWGSQYGNIRHTTDGGETWVEQIPNYSIPRTRFYGLYFVDQQHGWAVVGGMNGRVYRTTDGSTWDEVPQASFPGINWATYLLGVHFEDQSVGWVVGGREWPAYDTGVIYATTDGGVSWAKQWDIPDMCLYDVWFTNRWQGWAVGGGRNFAAENYWGGVILHTDDGGQSWHEQYRDDWGPHLGGVCFVDDLTGWVTGAEYSGDGVAILCSTDGGQTWVMDAAVGSWPLDVSFNGVHFVDAYTGWAVGRDRRVVKYSSQPAFIAVTSPATGASWWVGDWEDIEWSSSGTSGWVDLEVSRDGGANWTAIMEGTQDDGSESWWVTGPPSVDSYVRIVDIDGDPWGTSGHFTIAQPTVVVTSPAAGETWWVGDEEHIQWTSSGTSGTVGVEISRDSGSTWSTIDSCTADDGDYAWTVSGPHSSGCQIRVTDSDGIPSGTSGTFTIATVDIVVTSPAPGETWWVGDGEHIQWTSSGTSGTVGIEISRDSGFTWSTIDSCTADNGDYAWTVYGPGSSGCQIRVTDSDGTPSGTSGTFTISIVAAQEPPGSARLDLQVVAPYHSTPEARLQCSIPWGGRASLAVYDLAGRRLGKLHDGYLAAGTWVFRWGADSRGALAPQTGVYLGRLEACGRMITRRFVLLE